MRDHIDQPQARKTQQADKNYGNGIYGHAMPILIIAFRAFIFREVGDWRVIWLGITDRGVLAMISMRSTPSASGIV